MYQYIRAVYHQGCRIDCPTGKVHILEQSPHLILAAHSISTGAIPKELLDEEN